jgi:hypothetical protein
MEHLMQILIQWVDSFFGLVNMFFAFVTDWGIFLTVGGAVSYVFAAGIT